MPAPNLFEELKTALTTFDKFLSDNVEAIKPVIQPLSQLVPQIKELITKLIDLINKLKTEVEKLNPDQVPGLDKVTQFTTATKALLTTAKSLLPNEAATIDDVLTVANVVSSLPSVTAVKQEVLRLIDSIKTNLDKLKS